MRGLDADELFYLLLGSALPSRDPRWYAVARRLVERGLVAEWVVMRDDGSTQFIDRTPAALQLLALYEAGEV